MADSFKVGDIVQLKSGGPLMTVSNIDKYGYDDDLSAACDWFVQDKAPWKRDSGTFKLTSLRLIESA